MQLLPQAKTPAQGIDQDLTAVRGGLVDAIPGLSVEAVRVVVGDVGGGFGMKTGIYPEDIAVAYAAWTLNWAMLGSMITVIGIAVGVAIAGSILLGIIKGVVQAVSHPR